MSNTPFDGCGQRIERAQVHREAFSQIWNRFTDDHVYDVVVNVERDGAGGIWIKPLQRIPPVLSLELGEILYQLRAALDSCVYEAAILDSGKNPPPHENHLYFPIVDSPAEFTKRCSRDIAPLAQKRRDIIESVQPYNTPVIEAKLMVKNFNRSLSILNDWARKDRHRKIHVTGSWVTSANPDVRVPAGCTLASMTAVGSGFLEHKDQIASFKIEGYSPGMKVQANPRLALNVGVDELPPPCAENDTLGNRIDTMIRAVWAIFGSIRDSFQ